MKACARKITLSMTKSTASFSQDSPSNVSPQMHVALTLWICSACEIRKFECSIAWFVCDAFLLFSPTSSPNFVDIERRQSPFLLQLFGQFFTKHVGGWKCNSQSHIPPILQAPCPLQLWLGTATSVGHLSTSQFSPVNPSLHSQEAVTPLHFPLSSTQGDLPPQHWWHTWACDHVACSDVCLHGMYRIILPVVCFCNHKCKHLLDTSADHSFHPKIHQNIRICSKRICPESTWSMSFAKFIIQFGSHANLQLQIKTMQSTSCSFKIAMPKTKQFFCSSIIPFDCKQKDSCHSQAAEKRKCQNKMNFVKHQNKMNFVRIQLFTLKIGVTTWKIHMSEQIPLCCDGKNDKSSWFYGENNMKSDWHTSKTFNCFAVMVFCSALRNHESGHQWVSLVKPPKTIR